MVEPILTLAQEFLGPLDVVVMDGRQGHALEAKMAGSWRAIRAIRRVAGVLAAGRRVRS